jgi:hypothetical protein
MSDSDLSNDGFGRPHGALLKLWNMQPDEHIVQNLLYQGFHANFGLFGRQRPRNVPLEYAILCCWGGQVRLVRLLLKHHSDLRSINMRVLSQLSIRKQENIVNLIRGEPIKPCRKHDGP